MTDRPSTELCLRFMARAEARDPSADMADDGRWRSDAREEIVRRVEVYIGLVSHLQDMAAENSQCPDSLCLDCLRAAEARLFLAGIGER